MLQQKEQKVSGFDRHIEVHISDVKMMNVVEGDLEAMSCKICFEELYE